MAIIETKYNIGDIVYNGDSEYKTQYIECPDCLGTKIVHITFADKRVQELSCYTCKSYGYEGHSKGHLDFKNWLPIVQEGTVIGVDFIQGKAQYQVNYGQYVYKGNIVDNIGYYDEDCLCSNKEEAFVKATQEVERRNASELESTFKKKGSFAKRLQESHLTYDRQNALKEERNMDRWIKAIKGERR